MIFFFNPCMIFIMSSTGHLENISSLSYTDLSNVNTFHYIIISDITNFIRNVPRSCQAYFDLYKYSKIQIFTFKKIQNYIIGNKY